MKLPAHAVRTGQARRGLPGKVISFYIVPFDPAYKAGVCGARSGQIPIGIGSEQELDGLPQRIAPVLYCSFF